MFAAAERGEVPKSMPHEWAHHTKSIKSLPEHVKKPKHKKKANFTALADWLCKEAMKAKDKHFRSKAQQRFFFAAEERGDLPEGTALRWAHRTQKTRSIKSLPKHVKHSSVYAPTQAAGSRAKTNFTALADLCKQAHEAPGVLPVTPILNPYLWNRHGGEAVTFRTR